MGLLLEIILMRGHRMSAFCAFLGVVLQFPRFLQRYGFSSIIQEYTPMKEKSICGSNCKGTGELLHGGTARGKRNGIFKGCTCNVGKCTEVCVSCG